MACLQFSIGVFNDIADAPRDRERFPPKPIPQGLVSIRRARLVGAVLAGVGLLLVLPSGPAVLAVATAGLALGLAYDFALSQTPWSWLPLAIAIPLVPLFAWLGASGSVTPSRLAIVPIGVLAGGALAVSNSLTDLEIDRAQGRRTVAVALGPTRAWWVQAIGLVGAATLVALVLPRDSAAVPLVIAGGSCLLLIGLLAVRSTAAARSRLGWQFQAAGVAVLAVAWALATTKAG